MFPFAYIMKIACIASMLLYSRVLNRETRKTVQCFAIVIYLSLVKTRDLNENE